MSEPSDDRIQVAKPWLPSFDDFAVLARDIFDRRQLSNFATYAEMLETRAGEALGCEALAVSSCDIGMTLAWRALGIERGEVIVPSFTLGSTVNELVWNGLTPVFADIDPVTLCIDPGDAAQKVTADTVGIVGVHVFGEPVSRRLDDIAGSSGLALVFDAAHGIGTTDGGSSLAGRGDASVFSLSGTKIVTAGEGGIASFRDPAVRERFQRLRGYGFGADYVVHEPGLNGKISELNAALGHLSFEMLDEMVARRRQIADRYRHRLVGRAGITMQPTPADGDTRSYKDLAVLFIDGASRAAAEHALAAHGVETKRYFHPAHTMPAFSAATRPLPVTDDVWSRVLCLPIYHDLADEQIDRVCDIVLDALGS